MRAVIILTIFTCMMIGDALWWRWADRRLRAVGAARGWRILLGVWVGWLFGYLLLMFAMPHLFRQSNGPVPTPVHAAVFLWHILVLPATGVWIGISRLVRLILPRQTIQTNPAEALAAATTPVSGLSRRQFLTSAAIAAPPIATGLLVHRAMGQLGDTLRVREMEVVLPALPPDLDGMTIAHVSDMHVGKFTRTGFLPRLAEQVNQLRADFVAVTGDLIDMSLTDLPAALDLLNRLDPRQGLVVCEGNHDLMDDPDAFELAMRRSGHPFLRDDQCTTQFRGRNIQFLGIRWDHGSSTVRPAVAGIAPIIRPDAFPILLAHHPHAFDPAIDAGIPLTLSGHTHGGQLMLTKNFGAGPIMFRYWSGLYQRNSNALVVSNGVGAWFPLRVNAPAEIIHLTLRSPKI